MKALKLANLVLMAFLASAFGYAQGVTPQSIITTVAGTSPSFQGDGNPAVDAPLGGIFGVTVDTAGNFYAADKGNNLVVRISPDGILTVVAGNGAQGFSGDGGLAINASLKGPFGLVLDSAGNLYVTDQGNNRIRKVDPNGNITTVAGTGVAGFSGDGGPAISARLNAPRGMALDGAGDLYVVDYENQRVRKLNPNGTITTFAGNGNKGFSGDGGPAINASLSDPADVAIDAAGNVYISDQSGYRVRKVSPRGVISTVAGNGNFGFSGDGGPAISATLANPTGLCLDASGNLYIVDNGTNRVRKVSADGTISTVAGSGVRGFSGDGGLATSASLEFPVGVAVDGLGNIYIGDQQNLRVRKVDSGGIITAVAGNGLFGSSGDGGPATSATLGGASEVTVDGAGNLYVSQVDYVVRKVSSKGIVSTVGGNRIYGSSGNGGLATNASIGETWGVAIDGAGNLYVPDYAFNNVRKINTAGIISTVAGNGSRGFSGDGGKATAASLNGPINVAVDAAGNLYIADYFNQRVRQVSSGGIITTVAGNGVAGSAGDGGPAAGAQLSYPAGLAVDGAGDLYIAEYGGKRVRMVSSAGTISTVAGNGVPGFSGDGGLATNASLGGPVGLSLDAAGNLYIAEGDNNRVREVTVSGVITTVAGSGPTGLGAGGFSGDGGLAISASLNQPRGLAVDAGGNLYVADYGNDRIRKVLAVTPSFTAAPATLNFVVSAGTPIVVPRQISMYSSIAGLSWTVNASTQNGGGWLTVSPVSGSTPGIITANVNTTNLAPGTYRGTVAVNAPVANPPSLAVAVTLTVTAAQAAKLAAAPSALTFQASVGLGNPAAQTFRITNGGGGTLNWTAQPSTVTGGNWLAVSPASGAASSGSPASVQVSVNASGLAAGVYSGSVAIASPGGGSQQVTVTLLVSQPQQTILVSQSGLLFTGVEGGASVPSQTFGILNTGTGTMNWSLQPTTLSGGNWLSVTTSSGSSTAASLQVPLVEVDANVTGLQAGQYSGQIRVGATGAGNSPQFVTVTLNVLPAGSNPGALVRPTGLIFVRQAGTSSPGSQTVQLATGAPGTLESVLNPATLSGGSWMDVLPRDTTFSASQSQAIVVQPTLGTLAPGEYFGALTLLFSDRTSQTVNVLFVVTPPAGVSPSRITDGEIGRAAEQGCAPQNLYVTARSLGSGFTSQVGWPSQVQAQVQDECGNLVPNAGVQTSFSNGDPPVTLISLGNGLYENTWRPINNGPVRITVLANLPPLAPGQVQVDGQANGNATAPALSPGGIVSAASFAPGAPLAPGSIVSVFGQNLAASQAGASVVPLPTSLGGATLTVGGINAPLFYGSGGQINAQLPFELVPTSQPQVVVTTRSSTGSVAITGPETIPIAAASPEIFTTNQQGTGQGVIENSSGKLVDSGAPAAAGNTVQVFATGLGVTQPSVASGSPAPSAEPLARVTVPVQAQIGGLPASVQFAGLAPGYVGLYQVNVQIPAGVSPGPSVPLVLFQNGVPSNTATLAIQ